MKKLITMLGAFALTTTSVTSVVACEVYKNTQTEPDKNTVYTFEEIFKTKDLGTIYVSSPKEFIFGHRFWTKVFELANLDLKNDETMRKLFLDFLPNDEQVKVVVLPSDPFIKDEFMIHYTMVNTPEINAPYIKLLDTWMVSFTALYKND